MTQYIYEAGARVRLNSGGPDMTVTDVVPDSKTSLNGWIHCVWFQDNYHENGEVVYFGEPLEATFRSECLIVIEEDITEVIED